MAWQYSEKTKQLFMDAVQGKSGAHVGEIENPDGVGEHGSVACGDALKFMFRVQRDASDPLKDKIVEAKFLTFGCTSAIAASEALCRIIEERALTPIEALKITNQDIVEYLEGLPTQKIHCSVMGAEALETAVFDWAKKRGVDMAALGLHQLNNDEHEGRLVCSCFGITEPYLRRKIKELNLKTVDEVTGAIKAGGACGTCRGEIQDIINEIWSSATCATGTCELPQETQAAIDEFLNAKPEPNQPEQAGEAPQREGSFIQLATVTQKADGSYANGPTLADAENPDAAALAASRAEYADASPYKRAKLIEKVIEEVARPVMKRDGGDVEIVDVKDNLVYVSLVGACEDCESATLTLEMLVETVLQDRLDPNIKIVQI